jgi:tRNA(fMet)-specific endonuclease VapC
MTYMLDTDTFSNLVHSHGKVELRYALVGATATCISTITVQEIEFGRWLHPERMRRLNSRIDALLREIPAVPFDFEDARTAGRIRAALHRTGNSIGRYDALIASAALTKGLILVTSNTREFCRVEGLQLEDWRDGTLEVREPRTEYRVNVRRPMRTAQHLPPLTLS